MHELAEIHDYLAAVASPENALWTIERILSRAEQIAVFPQIGREVEDFSSPSIGEVTEGS